MSTRSDSRTPLPAVSTGLVAAVAVALAAGCSDRPPKGEPPDGHEIVRSPLVSPFDPDRAVEPPEDAASDEQYTVVKVYYATDRAPQTWDELLSARAATLYGLTLGTAVFTLLAAWFARRRARAGRRKWHWRVLAVLGMAGLVVAGGLTVCAVFGFGPALVGLERTYGAERGELQRGFCEVSIPKHHQVGNLESPSVLRLEFREDPERHVTLHRVIPVDAEGFYADMRRCVAGSRGKEAFVFIHGYRVGFGEAARRTAQIAYDLKFDGAPIFFSWPSQEALLQYTVDETNMTWAVPDLRAFLREVAEQSGAESVHLIAHSMGNRGLGEALRELAVEFRDREPMFHQVVLTAPDVDADVFKRDIAPAIVKTARRVTLYASSNDEALALSKRLHGYARAGDSGEGLIVVPGIDTIDVSEVDTSLIGHSYYGDNGTVLADLFDLLRKGYPPAERRWLRAETLGQLKYWIFERIAGKHRPEG